MSKALNLPNILALFRIALAPLMLWFFIDRNNPIFSSWHPSWFDYFAGLIFVIASVTDFFDGFIARSWNQMTKLGGILDPLADKMLVCSAMICLVSMHILPAWICIVIVAREFIISGFRLIAADKGTVIAAGWWGKFKTTFQMLMVIFMIANIELKNLYVLTQILMWAALILTVISLVDYLVKNKNVIDTTNI